MATVYLAHDVKHDREVAVKVLRADVAQNVGAERFLREIQLVAKLSHPHILPLYDSGSAGAALYFVMPNVTGGSLRDRLDQARQLPVDEAVRIAVEVAGALDFAHRHNVVHRDIKPENIMLQDGHAQVADFGIGKALADSQQPQGSSDLKETLTQTGMSIGTPAYMSPEQAAGEAADGRSDLYSLGCMLYEMLVGEPPFTGPSAQVVIAKRFVQTPADVAALRDGVPRTVARALQKALARSPADRHDTAALFAAACCEVETAEQRSELPEKSVVVLPFENMSADRDTDYFADGISEEIINALSQCADLRVAARTSAFSFKGRHDDLRTISEKLQVRHVLEGSVRKAGSRLRITAQLISAADGFQLWSERYDREMTDVFAIQDEIATAIATKLQVTLGAAEREPLSKPATADLEAYDEYLKGMALMHRRGIGILEAIDCFRNAAGKDPNYGPALAGLAHALALAAFWGIADPDDVRQPARDAAARALAADPTLVAAQVAAAMVAIAVEFDRAKAAAAWERAVALGPADVDARSNRALFHLCYVVGNFEAAISDLRLAMASDPLNHTLHSQLALALTFGGQQAEAVAEARQAIAMDRNSFFGHWVLIHALLAGGENGEVITTGVTIMRRFGRNTWMLLGMAGAYAALKRGSEANAIYDELVARSRTEYVQPTVLAMTAISVGRRDEAMAWLTQAAESRDVFLVPMLLQAPTPAAVALRREPEHARIVQQLGWDSPLEHPTPASH